MEFWPTCKDPQATLDYLWDWKALSNGNGPEDWLAPGETIIDYTVTVDAGLTLVSHALVNNGTSVLMWVSGGDDRKQYKTHCKIATSQTPREDERTRILRIEQL